MIDYNKYLNTKTKAVTPTATVSKGIDYNAYLNHTINPKVPLPVSKIATKTISQSPFNPQTPAHEEFITQLDLKAPSTSIIKNFWGSLGGAFKEVGSLVAGKESLPYETGKFVKDYATGFAKPTELVKETEKALPQNQPITKFVGQGILRAIVPFMEPYAHLMAKQLDQSRQIAETLDAKPQTIGKQVQTGIEALLETNPLSANDVVEAVMASTPVAFLIIPFITKMTQEGLVKFSNVISKESKIPITYQDLQKITTSTSDAQAVSRVGLEKYNAYKEATLSNNVRESLKQGYVVLAEKQPTTFSNILKNVATRPISQIVQFGKTYGAKIQTITPELLPEKVVTAKATNGLKIEVKPPIVIDLNAPVKPILAPETAIIPKAEIIAPTLKTTPISIIKPTIGKPISQEITIPKTNEFQSRVFERMKAENPALEGDLNYDPIKLKEDTGRAVELITKDKQKAYDIAMGKEKSTEITSTAVNIALAEKALSEGNNTLYSKLIINRSLEQTRRGQEIVAEKGSVIDNSVSRYVKELISAKLDKLGKDYLTGLKDEFKKQSPKQKVMAKIDGEIGKLELTIKNKKLDVKTALSLLEKLTCI